MKLRNFLYFTKQPNLNDKPGGLSWLISKEQKYGGMHTNIPRNKVSPLDPRTEIAIATGGMVGGDRMLHHGYAKYYEKHLKPFLRSKHKLTLIEVGILKGAGLAIWCDLFPSARIIGLDIDLDHFRANYNYLKSTGAFESNEPEIYEYDQFILNKSFYEKILADDEVDIFIDDGFHSNESIITTIDSVRDFLSANFVYFIEDNSGIGKILADKYKEFRVYSYGKLTILTMKN